MAEKPSDTSDDQRLDKMFCHLTPHKAVVPYSIAFDEDKCLYVASKGGLFKVEKGGKEIMWSFPNEYPKKMSAYAQVSFHANKIFHIQNEDKTGLSEFKIYSLAGDLLHDSFIDGRVMSLAINGRGEMFMTKQAEEGQDEFFIFTTTVDKPTGWDELVVLDEKPFQALALYDDDTIIVATVTLPINMYSKESLRWVDIKNKKLSAGFSSHGKEKGEIYFPRAIRRIGEDVLVLDKTGRFQTFDRNGKYIELKAEVDAYLANGFELIEDNQALVVCSGIVYDENKETVCDDWLEKITLNGSTWKSERG
uniref:WD40 repeat domain-containing protein n=1 Tax=Rhabditophanes sp. KR3021 TaxID=114890 RepID=A0AC35TTT6_9BILA